MEPNRHDTAPSSQIEHQRDDPELRKLIEGVGRLLALDDDRARGALGRGRRGPRACHDAALTAALSREPHVARAPMRPLIYLADGYPCLSQTFTLREVRGLHADGAPVSVVALHVPGEGDPPLDPALDPPVTYLPLPLSAEVVAAAARTALAHPSTACSLLGASLLPHTTPWRSALQARAPVHLAWASWLAPRLPRDAHVHAQFVGSASNVAWMASRLSGATFSFTAHADFGLPFLRQKLRDATVALSISELERSRMLTLVPDVPPGRIVVSRLGVDVAAWDAPAPRAEAGAPLRLLAVGTLGAKKGHDVLIRAMADLRRRVPRVHLDIVGGGPLRASLGELVARLGLGDVVSLRGPLPHEEIRRMTMACDIAVLACRTTGDGDFDGIPVVLMEAMAARRAVVSTRVSAIPELIEDGVSGRLVAPERPDLLTSALEELAGDAALRRTLGEGARLRVAADYNASVARERVKRIFTDLLSAPPRAPAR